MKPDFAMIDKTLLAGATALITDGSPGIGEAITEAFARAGANVAVCARSPEHRGPMNFSLSSRMRQI